MTNKFLYCHMCGSELSLNSKFCSKCGVSLSSLSEKPKPIASKQEDSTILTVGQDDEDYENDELSNYLDKQKHYIPKIEALSVEIQQSPSINKETIRDISTNPFSSASTEKRTPLPKMSTKKFLEEFKKEAGTLRQN